MIDDDEYLHLGFHIVDILRTHVRKVKITQCHEVLNKKKLLEWLKRSKFHETLL